MSHLEKEKQKLVARIKRIRGQVDSIERSLTSGDDCADVLRLLAGTAEDQCAAGGVHLVGETLERLNTGGVEGGHVAQADDEDRRQRGKLFVDRVQLFRAAEEERTVDAEDGDVVWNLPVLQDV